MQKPIARLLKGLLVASALLLHAVPASADMFYVTRYNHLESEHVASGLIASSNDVTWTTLANHDDNNVAAPMGVALDSAGDVFLGDFFGNPPHSIIEWRTNSTVVNITANGIMDGNQDSSQGLYGLAVDSNNIVWVADTVWNFIVRVAPDGSYTWITDASFSYPTGLICDPSNNLYVANSLGNSISKIAPNGTVTVWATNGLNHPWGLALDAGGNIYAVNNPSNYQPLHSPSNDINNSVVKISPNGTATLFTTNNLNNPLGIAIDSNGHIWVVNHGDGVAYNGVITNSSLQEFLPDGTPGQTFTNGLDGPTFLAIKFAPQTPASLPSLATEPATNLTLSTATLLGSVNPNGSATTAFFQWGTTTNYGNVTAATSVGTGTGFVAIASALNGLTAGVQFHYSAIASNNGGIAVGADQTFTTLADSAGDGIADVWRQQFFGTTNVSLLSCATCDATGTGQDNLFKYLAGLDPTNPASVFMLQIVNSPNQPTQKNLIFAPVIAGRTYTPLYTTNLVAGGWLPLTGYTGPITNGNQLTITDTNSTDPQRCYRISITYP